VKTSISAIRKITSAIRSYLKLSDSFNVRIERKENKLHIINKIVAMPVNSSIMVSSLNLEIFNDVSTMRQNPSKLEDVFKM
jgi:hypothetical protein